MVYERAGKTTLRCRPQELQPISLNLKPVPSSKQSCAQIVVSGVQQLVAPQHNACPGDHALSTIHALTSRAVHMWSAVDRQGMFMFESNDLSIPMSCMTSLLLDVAMTSKRRPWIKRQIIYIFFFVKDESVKRMFWHYYPVARWGGRGAPVARHVAEISSWQTAGIFINISGNTTSTY